MDANNRRRVHDNPYSVDPDNLADDILLGDTTILDGSTFPTAILYSMWTVYQRRFRNHPCWRL